MVLRIEAVFTPLQLVNSVSWPLAINFYVHISNDLLGSADGLSKDIANPEARYTNPPKTIFKQQQSKKPRLDLSLERDAWVSGCTAALPRRDSSVMSVRGAPPRGGNPRGQWKRGYSSVSGTFKRGYVHPRGGWGRGRGRGHGR
jgi:hypothetical protein